MAREKLCRKPYRHIYSNVDTITKQLILLAANSTNIRPTTELMSMYLAFCNKKTFNIRTINALEDI